MLKALAALQDAVLAEDFDRKAWDKAVRGAADLVSLRDALGELQTAVRDDRPKPALCAIAAAGEGRLD